MRPPRFSLRGLLLLTACLAVFCYWRDRPRRIINQFAAAIEADDTEAMGSLQIEKLGGKWVGFGSHVKVISSTMSQTPMEWLAGRCTVEYELAEYTPQEESTTIRGNVTAWGILITYGHSRPLGLPPDFNL